MKRNTPFHPKVGMLAGLLGIKRYEACGILELLWHFTAQYCPQGDVGKRTDAQIAAFIEWPVDQSGRLIDALVESNWLDRDPEYRLIIHDWHDHSDGTCDKYLAEKGLKYATSRDPRRLVRLKSTPSRDKSRQVATSRDSRACARVPESESESEPLPQPPDGGSESASEKPPEDRPENPAAKAEAEDLVFQSLVSAIREIPEVGRISYQVWREARRTIEGHPGFARIKWPDLIEHIRREAVLNTPRFALGKWLAARLADFVSPPAARKSFGRPVASDESADVTPEAWKRPPGREVYNG